MMTNLGLILIIAGWILQFFSHKKEINKNFVIIYGIGVALLVIEGFANKLYSLGVLNLLSLITAVAVYWKIKKW